MTVEKELYKVTESQVMLVIYSDWALCHFIHHFHIAHNTHDYPLAPSFTFPSILGKIWEENKNENAITVEIR